MPIFALEKINKIEGRIDFFKLTVNSKCQFDEFWEEISSEGSYTGELTTIQIRMQSIAEMQLLPQNKFKNITPRDESVKEYEIKTKHLRVYLFHEEHSGKVIVYGGKKTSQKRDIKKFRSIKRQYLSQK